MKKLPFWNAPYPFNDFISISSKDSKSLNSEYLLKKARDIKLNYYNKLNHGSIDTFVFSSQNNIEGSGNYVVFSGVANINRNFIFGQNNMLYNQIKSIDISNSIGIFTSLSDNSERIIITQDFFGFGSLFYYESDDLLIVSNRYHLLLLFLSWIGYKGRLNQKKIIANLYSNSTFLQQNITREMDIEGILQLSFDKEIEITSIGWKIRDKTSVKKSFEGQSPEEYYRLLEQGKDEVIENIACAIESGVFKMIVSDLSGGIDSRIILGAILNIENLIDSVEFLTKDVPGSLDLPIAAGLTNLFNGKFFRDNDSKQYPYTVEERLEMWRSYFMGTYHRLGLSAWSTKGENVTQVRLSGGGGELYREFWTKVYKNVIRQSNSMDEMVDKLIDAFPSIGNPDVSVKYDLKELVIKELITLPGTLPKDKLDSHYLYYRNRYHFGMKAFDYNNDSSIWYPLMSRSLFMASKSTVSKSDADLLLELTERLHPLLVNIEYDSEVNRQNISPTDIRYKRVNIVLDKNIDSWQKSLAFNKSNLLSRRPKMDVQFNNEWRDVNNSIKNQLIENLNIFDSVLNVSKLLVNETFINQIESMDDTSIKLTYSKVMSLIDQYHIFNN